MKENEIVSFPFSGIQTFLSPVQDSSNAQKKLLNESWANNRALQLPIFPSNSTRSLCNEWKDLDLFRPHFLLANIRFLLLMMTLNILITSGLNACHQNIVHYIIIGVIHQTLLPNYCLFVIMNNLCYRLCETSDVPHDVQIVCPFASSYWHC